MRSHVVITGANRGIGAVLAELYRADGEQVTDTSRNSADALVPLDVTRPDDQTAFARHLDGAPVDLLVCNAGIYADKGQSLDHGYPARMWQAGFETNVMGVFLSVQALLPNLRKANRAKIAIISSQMASHHRAPGGSYIYRASKAAALNLGRNLAADLKPEGIAVGIYHPGWVRTDMGGPEGEISPQEAALGLKERFQALSLDTTGCFETWDGRAHAY